MESVVVAADFSIRRYLISDIWLLIVALLPVRDLLNFGLCSHEVCQFIGELRLPNPLFLNFGADVKEFSRKLKERRLNDSVRTQCIHEFVCACRMRKLCGRDSYRLIKLCSPSQISSRDLTYIVRYSFWDKAFNLIYAGFRGKSRRIMNAIVKHYLENHTRLDKCVLGNDTKFPLEFRNFEVCIRLRQAIVNLMQGSSVEIRDTICTSINPGETITIPLKLLERWYPNLEERCSKFGIYLCVYKDKEW